MTQAHVAPVQDPRLIPPHILMRVLSEIETNREFDMGGYSVPTTTAFEQFTVVTEPQAN